jgi:lipopolysaccharide export system permease protein
VPQALSMLIVFCSIVVVSQLVRLSEVLVTFGLSLENVFLPFLYIILPLVHMIIPIAYLLAVVITFSRLSADGEWAALLAAGFPLRRAAVPTLLVAVVFYGLAAASALNLEAWGRRELVQFFYRKSQTELDNLVKYKMQSGVFLDDFLGYVLYAEKISSDRTSFENVLLAPGGDAHGKGNFTLLAPSGNIAGSVEGGDLRLSLDNGIAYAAAAGVEKPGQVSVLKFNRAEIDLLRIFREQIIGADSAEDDFRSFTNSELMRYIDGFKAKAERTGDEESIFRRARYLWHQRIAAPFAVVTFAFFGMVLGVTDPRRGKSYGYAGAILTIILGYVMLMGCKALAESYGLNAPLAAWLPNVALGLLGGFLLFQKNRLPPSEGTLDRDNLPFLGAWLRRRRWAGPR